MTHNLNHLFKGMVSSLFQLMVFQVLPEENTTQVYQVPIMNWLQAFFEAPRVLEIQTQPWFAMVKS